MYAEKYGITVQESLFRCDKDKLCQVRTHQLAICLKNGGFTADCGTYIITFIIWSPVVQGCAAKETSSSEGCGPGRYTSDLSMSPNGREQ